MTHMSTQFRIAIGLLLVALFAGLGTYLGWWSLFTSVGPFVLGHWFGIVAAAYLLLAVPAYACLKRRTSVSRGRLLQFHVFGNLLVFILIVAHFAQQMARPAEFAPSWGTGLAGFILFLFVVAAGLSLRFGLIPAWRRTWRLIHVGGSLIILIVIGIHALENFGLF